MFWLASPARMADHKLCKLQPPACFKKAFIPKLSSFRSFVCLSHSSKVSGVPVVIGIFQLSVFRT